MAKTARPSWATHIVSLMTPTPNHPNRATRKEYWYAVIDGGIRVQRTESQSAMTPVINNITSKGGINWWRKHLRIERELEPMPFIAQLDADNAAIDSLPTLDRLLDLQPEEALAWLKANQEHVAIVPRKLNKRLRDAYNDSIEAFHDGEEEYGCPDDQWNAMLEEWEHGKA
ncbi:hypothetical protein [Alteromonas phage JH01]|nr:hypothetical protein [Alteromonas phage JH01]